MLLSLTPFSSVETSMPAGFSTNLYVWKPSSIYMQGPPAVHM